MTALVLQTAFLGDVYLSIPLCKALRNLPGVDRVALVTTPAAAEALRNQGVADVVMAYDKRGVHRSRAARQELLSELRALDINILAVVPHKSFRSMLFVRALAPERIITFRDAASRIIATDVVPYPRHMHEIDRQLALLGALGETVPTAESFLPVTLYDNKAALEMEKYITGSSGIVVLAPGSVWPTKRWPDAYFNNLAKDLRLNGNTVVIVGDTSTKSEIEGGDAVIDLRGKTSLPELAAVIARANVVVSNDSLPVHIASLQQVPVVAIFGPTIPEFGFSPLGETSKVVERTDLPCRPCSSHGTIRCPVGTHSCMQGISVDTVLAAVHSIIHAHDGNRHASTQTGTTT